MANFWYTAALTALMNGDLDLVNDDIRAVLVKSTHTPQRDAHDNLDDISGGDRVATSGALQNKSVSAGSWDADDYTFSALSGAAFSQVILYKHTGTESDSTLILRIDQGANLPYTPDGSDFDLVWAAAGIARLSHT